jgi:dihydrolipoamide dehydrogenase
MADRRQLAILGAGPGGYAAAFLAADRGLDVVLIDPEERPGGVCLYRGCIPTKALLSTAKVIQAAERSSQMGLRFGKPDIDMDQVRSWRQSTVDRLTKGLGQLAKARKIEAIRGTATFTDSHTLTVDAGDGDRRQLPFENAIIATGARPASLPGADFDGTRILDSAAALQLKGPPHSLLVVGAGYIGLELGTVYSSLGTKVTIVEMMDNILPLADEDLVKEFRKQADGLFQEIVLGSKAELEVSKKKVRATFSEGGQKDYDAALITIGRVPNTESLGLENTDVEVNDDGFIIVDAQRRTGDEAIFAIGDVTGAPLLAHKANAEGRVAAEVISGRDVAFDPAAIPAVEYTEPEIAWTGLTEKDAKRQDRRVEVARFPWSASGRAVTRGNGAGLTKLVVDPENERILGAGIVGEEAGELISEATLAIEMAARVADLDLTIHPHPTLSETVMEAAAAYAGTATHIRSRGRRQKT